MLKKTIEYVDYNGVERKEDWYFNLNKAEVTEMEFSVNGGFGTLLEKIVAEQDGAKLMEWFKKIILMAVGKKSLDGRRFEKNDEIRNEFEQTEAYVELFMELSTNADAASDFIKGILPQDEAKKTTTPAPSNVTPLKS